MENYQVRSCVPPGTRVKVAVKRGGTYSRDLVEGTVMEVLTNSRTHPRGIKVRLTGGTVGRVQEIC